MSRLQWSAPEVCAGTAIDSTPATTASDVYMVGSLAYELLTGGTPPFHWLAGDLQSAGRVPFPGLRGGLPGLLGKSVLEVAADDGEPIPWCVRAEGTLDWPGRLAELKALLEQCLAAEPEVRPKLPTLLAAFRDLLVREEEEDSERAAGIGGGLSTAARASAGPVSSAPPTRTPLPASTALPFSAAAGQSCWAPAGVCGFDAKVFVVWTCAPSCALTQLFDAPVSPPVAWSGHVPGSWWCPPLSLCHPVCV